MSGQGGIVGAVHELLQADPRAPSLCYRDLGRPESADICLDYGQLWQEAACFAQRLEDLPPGGQVLIVMPLGLRLLAAHLGVLMQGGMASIFTHPSEKIQSAVYERNLQNALRLMGPQAVISGRAFAGAVQGLAAEKGFTIIVAEEVEARGGFEPTLWREASRGDIAVIQYSSGSTGLQKGVALSHAMVLDQCRAYAKFIGLDRARDHICSWLPMYHDMGLFTSWLMPLTQGVPVSFVDPFEWVKTPLSLLRLLDQTGGTLCWQPNFAYNLLASRATARELEGLNLSRVRGFSNCSEPVSAAAHDNFLAVFGPVGVKPRALWVCYAMAENAFTVTASGGPMEPVRRVSLDLAAYAQGRALAAGDGPSITQVSCGVPIEGCRVKVVDQERAELAEGLVGEIALTSPYLLVEYLHNPEATNRALDQEGWYYTGDLGFMLEGRLYVTGRQKDLIIVGGRNFFPQDIEAIVNAQEGAIPGRCVALGLEDEALGTQKVVVLVESRSQDSKQKSRLAAAIRQAVFEELDCPVGDVRVLEHMWLLKTSSGKIARQPNLERYQKELQAAQPPAQTVDGEPEAALFAGTAGFWETLAWSGAAAILIYIYVLFFVFGANESWNVYAGF